MSAAPTKVNVFNPTGPKKEGPSFQSSKPVCPAGQVPIQRWVQNPDSAWKRTDEWTCSMIAVTH
jgi:hypothetical protein